MKKYIKISLWILLGLFLIPVVIMFGLYLSADMGEPPLTINPSDYVLDHRRDTLLCGNSYLRQDSCGLWELYVQGSGQERGARQGALTSELMKYQEDVFINKIREIIPSDSYLSVLRTFLIIFNRNMGKYVPDEYRNEIMAMSEFCTHDYDAIGTPYERQLNYHGAHDIGHTMQQYMLVGCSSFAAWGATSEDGEMVVGRNFDFYVGDDFAKNKLITFAAPDSGFRYASVGWAGMIGVLSGMNEKGLTVTINAAKGSIPTSAAMPISILTREILQYAQNIEQAYDIAQRAQTFVSESILIGSANDNRAVVIEKTPKQTALYTPDGELLICTNHFQSPEFAQDEYNVENIKQSDSRFRYNRIDELIKKSQPINYSRAMDVLRNRLYLEDADMGLGNEMSVNQSIAHHSVIFMPTKGLMWVSTTPWQSGKVVCYDLKGFFDGTSLPCRESEFDLAADSLFMLRDYPILISYREKTKEIKRVISEKGQLSKEYINAFTSINPNHYYTYRLLGDYYASQGLKQEAVDMYGRALKCIIPSRGTREDIEKLKQREDE